MCVCAYVSRYTKLLSTLQVLQSYWGTIVILNTAPNSLGPQQPLGLTTTQIHALVFVRVCVYDFCFIRSLVDLHVDVCLNVISACVRA